MKTRISLISCLIYFCLIVSASAQIPHTMNYQGSLKDAGGSAITSPGLSMTFALYDSLTGGNNLWEETINDVKVTNGIYSVILGQKNALSTLAFDTTYYLELRVGNEILTPRQPLTSVPYALNAANCASATTPAVEIGSLTYSWKNTSTVTVLTGQVTTDDGTLLDIGSGTDVSLDTHLDAGAKAANQVYFLWAGKDTSDQTVVRFSLSASSPANLSHPYRLEHFIETDASANIIRFSTPLPEIIPAGTIHMWAGPYIPLGCGICDGRAVSRTHAAYSRLFNIIGTTYGAGDGSTTYNLPDLRGRSPLGAGQGDGLTARNLGQTGGEEKHTLILDELPNWDIPYYAGNTNSGFPHHVDQNQIAKADDAGSRYLRQDGIIYSGGGDQPHNVMDPYQVIHFIIKF